MEKTGIPRVAALHDLSAFGRCALTVVIPTLSAMGIQVLPIPTALLSTHTGGFTDYYFEDMSRAVLPIASHWQSIGVRPDAIYTGFLAGEEQCDSIAEFIRRFDGDDTFVLVDPVFADEGVLYSSCTMGLVTQMRELCRMADAIVPNLTEACMLCGRPYPNTAVMEPLELRAYITSLLAELAELGPKKIAITGILTDRENNVMTAGLDLAAEGKPFFATLHRVGGMYPGTGDLFASVLLGKILSGMPFSGAVTYAGKFVRDVICASAKYDTPHRDGVSLEPCLRKLLEEK